LLAGTILFALRALAVVLTSDPLLVTLTMALHGGGFALFLVGGVSYVSERAPTGAAATAQGMLVAIAFGLAQIVGPGVGGMLAADGDLLRTFVIAGAGSVVAVLGMTWILRRSS
jgi:DHA1 family multidrug resistance protein-like MFS transporter